MNIVCAKCRSCVVRSLRAWYKLHRPFEFVASFWLLEPFKELEGDGDPEIL